jgi:hypothetical protein
MHCFHFPKSYEVYVAIYHEYICHFSLVNSIRYSTTICQGAGKVRSSLKDLGVSKFIDFNLNTAFLIENEPF